MQNSVRIFPSLFNRSLASMAPGLGGCSRCWWLLPRLVLQEQLPPATAVLCVVNSVPCCHPVPTRGTSAGAGDPAPGHGEHQHGLHEGSWHVSLLSPSSRELLCGPSQDPGLASDLGMLQYC